jgi:hypothetical protein
MNNNFEKLISENSEELEYQVELQAVFEDFYFSLEQTKSILNKNKLLYKAKIKPLNEKLQRLQNIFGKEMNKIVTKNPHLLIQEIERTEETFNRFSEFLKPYNFKAEELKKIYQKIPDFFSYREERLDKVEKLLELLKEFNFSEENVHAIIIKSPIILSYDSDNAKRGLKNLSGVYSAKDLIKLIVESPTILNLKTQKNS